MALTLYDYRRMFSRVRGAAPRTRLRRRRVGKVTPLSTQIKNVALKQAETKFNNIAVSATPVAGSTNVIRLSEMAQGLTCITRVGDHIRIMRLIYNLTILSDADVTKDTITRVVIVRQKTDCEGAPPLVVDVFETDDVNSLVNIDRGKDYTLLMDRIVHQRVNPTADDQSASLIRGILKFKGGLAESFSGNASTNTLVGTIYLFLMSNQASTFGPLVAGECRIEFKDI